MIELITIIVLFVCCMLNLFNGLRLAKLCKRYRLELFELQVENDRLKEDFKRLKNNA